MSKQPKWITRAMNLAIRRARYETAVISLDENDPWAKDTETIRAATKLYVESWLVPLLQAVRDGDLALAQCMCEGEDCSEPERHPER